MLTVAVVSLLIGLAGCGAPPATTKGPSTITSSCSQFKGSPTYRVSSASQLPVLDTVQFLTTQLGWVAGSQTVLETTDGGTAWHRIYSGTSTISRLDFINCTTGWILGTAGLGMTRNGGSTWNQLATPVPVANVMAIHLANNHNGVLLAGPTVNGVFSGGSLYQTTTGGKSWSKETLSRVAAIGFSSPSSGWAVVSAGAHETVWQTTDGGASWHQVSNLPVIQPTEGVWNASVQATSATTVWVLITAQYGAVESVPSAAFVSTDAGKTWRAGLSGAGRVSTLPSASMLGLQAGPFTAIGNSAFFLSINMTPSGNLLIMAATSDKGVSWTQVNIGTDGAGSIPHFLTAPLAVAASSPSTLWIAGSVSGHGTVIKSVNAGARWQSVMP
ncbi:MAG: YCF48-related protein [Sulfobacillus sp.]